MKDPSTARDRLASAQQQPSDDSFPLTPEQFHDRNSRARHLDGEARLLFAVLEDAIRCYTHAARNSHRSNRRSMNELDEWVNTRGDRYLFSFDSICTVFDIDPELLRRQLNSMATVNFRPRRFTTVARRMTIKPRD